MTRSIAREIAVHCSFAMGFTSADADTLLDTQLSRETFRLLGEEEPLYAEYPSEKQLAYIRALVRGVWEHAAELDSYIERLAVGWSFSRISRMAAAIMRVSMYEILYMPEIPNASAINEAVEIAKGYEEPQAVAFINGILGSFVRAEFPAESAPKPQPPKVTEEAPKSQVAEEAPKTQVAEEALKTQVAEEALKPQQPQSVEEAPAP